ncbi:hypothetical protein PVAP13_7KG242100 [Panicum virgatum]|uniref:Arp2/3 complex 34 kDa subunit n=1 Tax=Panicum virgatum TaxID=38727 RepID=A0A8T0QKC2_PANVG|nr:hypothetical protein PVAP13_7KG242100 [Panicum virgatum]
MAFFSSGSRALVEILTRIQSAERPMPVDLTFFEFGSIRYHVEASASDPENAYLSISTPPLSHEASPSSSGLPEATLQEARKAYHKFAEVVEPPREGYVLTLKLNFSGLARPKDRVKAINQVSRLQSLVLSSQLRDMLGSLGPSGTMKLVCSQREPFFVSRTAERIHAIFPMRFRDDTDLAIATSFFQELQDLGNSFAGAPRCSWSPIPPPELRGEHVHRLTTNGGFVSFGASAARRRLLLPRGSCGGLVGLPSHASWPPTQAFCRGTRGGRSGPPGRPGSCSTSRPSSSITSSAPGATSRAGCGSGWRP